MIGGWVIIFKISNVVTWVGKIDWEIKRFHSNEFIIDKGSSYNSYLVRDKKTVLIDTVWQPFAKEFVGNLKKEIDLRKIDYIIVNHSEMDHSGALLELMKEIPNTPIYCTENGAQILKAFYHEDWNFVKVKTGDILDLGKNKLIFIESRMLHWPDNMLTYLTGENILFSNDAFGQHYASKQMFNNKVDQCELYEEAIKYYANILAPYSILVVSKINELLALKLPIDMICPSHGVIWKDNPLQIVNKYSTWANKYQENQVTIIYDTMWNCTRSMADSIAEGIRESNKDVVIKLYNSSLKDKTDIITEIFKSKAVLIGSATRNKGILSSISPILDIVKEMNFKNKKAASFGSYGWSGEGVKIITTELAKAGFEVINDGIRELWNPDELGLKRCRDYGKNIGDIIR